jgi:hypothetical protein
MDKEQELSLLQITARYVTDVQAGRQPRLSEYLASYPRYADAIADFVAYYHAVEEAIPLMDTKPSKDASFHSTDVEPLKDVSLHSTDAINRVPTSRAINCDSSCDECRGNEEQEGLGGMETLLTTATGQRLKLSQMAAELDLSIDIVLLLEQRAIASATIPHVLCEKIAMLLLQPISIVQQYFDPLDQQKPGPAVQKRKQPMKVAEANTDYSVPYVVDKPSFRAIVETSLQLSLEQRSRWCAVLDAEGI